MNLMISENVLQLMPTATNDASTETISYAIGECALGQALVARSVSGVCAILMGGNHDELSADFTVQFTDAKIVANEAVVEEDLAKIVRFLSQPGEGLDFPLGMRGTPFQRRVREKLRVIPVGRMVTYTVLARWVSPWPRPVRSPAPAPPIRSQWPFLVTVSRAAMAIWLATARASSASAN